MTNILTKSHVDEIARQCGEMLNEGTLNLIQSEMFEDLIRSHDSLATTIESQQQELDKAEKHNKGAWEIADDLAGKIDLAVYEIAEKDTLIESQKEEIERYNELFQEIGIMCAFEQSPQILRILSVLQKFQQEGEK